METRRHIPQVPRYPYDDSTQVRHHNRDWATPVMLVIAFVMLIGIGGALTVIVFPGILDQTGNTPTTDAETGRVEIGDFEIQFHKIADPYMPTNELGLGATEGNRYVVIDAEVWTTSGDTEPIADLIQFELADSTGERHPVALFSDDVFGDMQTLTGDVPGNGSLRGVLAFEVPEGKGSPWSLWYLNDPFGDWQEIPIEVTP